MNYIGSKLKLIPFLKEEIAKVVGVDLSDRVFCDIFAGTGAVGRAFKGEVGQVISNDLEEYSFVLNKNYIQNHQEIKNKEDFIEELNALPLIDSGFVYKHYCMGSGSRRQYFSDFNGKKIDAIRTTLKKWKKNEKIRDDLYYFLLASLLESADKVANTASVYAAFLKHIKQTAAKELVLEPADFIKDDNMHQVFKEDANTLIKKIQGDILYLDPPYNQRQYGAYYHLLNTIAIYDDFTPTGITGMRNYNRSNYCSKGAVKKSFEALISNASFRYIFLSYNNEGLMSKDEVENIMKKYGKYDLATKTYQRFKSDKTQSRNHKATCVSEYLHILEKK